MIQKCVIVSYPMGRTGSSAMMGLLNLHGYFVGEDKDLVSAAPMNPKGFFELKDQDKFLGNVFKGFYPRKTNPPSVKWARRRAFWHKRKFRKYLDHYFGGQEYFAIKSPRCLSLLLFELLKDEYDISVICLIRNRADQSKSLSKVNPEDEAFFNNYLDNWYRFSEELISSISLKTVYVDFDEMMSMPHKTIENTFKNLGIEKDVDTEKIDSWLDNKLVNRK